jgi:hypothetical protein
MNAELGRWICEHQVCYETTPLGEVNHGGAVHVGYELTWRASDRAASGVAAN